MPASEWVLYGTSIVTCLVTAGGLIHNRRKPAVDAAQVGQINADEDHLRATITQMSKETNRDRDYRIWQLEQHYDRKIMPWQRQIIALVERLINLLRIEIEKNGGIMPDIEVPVAPDLPEPPHG
jgi:hypothetical protein